MTIRTRHLAVVILCFSLIGPTVWLTPLPGVLAAPAVSASPLITGEAGGATVLDSAGLLDIVTKPEGALVFLDDKKQGETPLTLKALATGRYRLLIEKEGYASLVYDLRVNASGGRAYEITELSADMNPASGSVHVTTDRDPAHLTLDGVYVGTTPKTLMDLSAGPHTLVLSKGDEERKATVRVEAGETTRETIRFDQGFGTLSVLTEPRGADVFLDGEFVGESPLTVRKVAEGRHEVRAIYKEDNLVKSTTVDLARGEGKTLELKLEPPVGTVEVRTEPSGADVYANGIYMGMSPVTLQRREEGAVRIRAEKGGRAATETTVAVKLEETVEALLKLGELHCPDGYSLIPAGSFKMGSGEAEFGRAPDELQRDVEITRNFCMGKTEVTQAQWERVMGKNPSWFKQCGADCPVEYASWHDVRLFIKTLNEKEGANGGKYRLPTEAEWEYAARAGTTTASYLGDLKDGECGPDPSISDAGWNCSNAGGQPHETGLKEPNPWGLYDMAGNVWEWVEDWYGPYAAGKAADPKGASTGVYKTIRGGSWHDPNKMCRSAFRGRFESFKRHGNLGFRLVMEL